jgi:hypothetical protein
MPILTCLLMLRLVSFRPTAGNMVGTAGGLDKGAPFRAFHGALNPGTLAGSSDAQFLTRNKASAWPR